MPQGSSLAPVRGSLSDEEEGHIEVGPLVGAGARLGLVRAPVGGAGGDTR